MQETDAPRVLLAWLFGTNTVMAVLLQVAAARGVDSVATSLRASRISAGFFVLSCLIVLVTHDTIGWTTILLVWVGHVTVTGAELFQSAGHWGFMSELSDPERRGEYQGAAQLGGTLGSVWAPAAYTFLAIEWGTPGWLLIGGVVVVATLGMGAVGARRRALPGARGRTGCCLNHSLWRQRRSGSRGHGPARCRRRSPRCWPAPERRRTSTARSGGRRCWPSW